MRSEMDEKRENRKCKSVTVVISGGFPCFGIINFFWCFCAYFCLQKIVFELSHIYNSNHFDPQGGLLSLAKENGWSKDKEDMTKFWTERKSSG